MESEIPLWLRPPLLGLYVKTFGCKMEEALVEELQQYESFMALFTRELKDGVRPVSSKHSLVWSSVPRSLSLSHTSPLPYTYYACAMQYFLPL